VGFGVSDAGMLSCKTIKNVLYRVSQKYMYTFSTEYYLDIHIRVLYLRGGTTCFAHDRRHGEIFPHDSILAVLETSLRSRQFDLEVLLNVLQVQEQ